MTRPTPWRRALPWALTALCMAAMLGFSSQQGGESESLSFRVTDALARLLGGGPLAHDSPAFLNLDFFVRKCAHVSEYCAMGLLLLWALGTLGTGRPLRLAAYHAVCLTFAMADEWLQTTVAGRVGCFPDVAVDMLGAALALGLRALFGLRGRQAARKQFPR